MLSASLALLLPNAAGFCPGTVMARPVIHARVEAPVACRLGGDMTRRDFVAVAASFALLPVQQAFAESTLVTRQQSYTRYVPRVERGRDYWAGGLRKQVANSDWKTISESLEKKVCTSAAAAAASAPASVLCIHCCNTTSTSPVHGFASSKVDQPARLFFIATSPADVPLRPWHFQGSIDRIFGPMELWSSSFSGKTITAKTLAMNDAIDDLREAASDLRSAALGKEGGGACLLDYIYLYMYTVLSYTLTMCARRPPICARRPWARRVAVRAC